MERVLDALVRGGGSYVCAECEHVLCSETENYRDAALQYDAPIGTGEPPELGPVREGEYILRHFCCPGCATLFEVEMLPAGAPATESVRLVIEGSA
jgi:N-methylhydantoinase B